jgi:hypothetical protein
MNQIRPKIKPFWQTAIYKPTEIVTTGRSKSNSKVVALNIALADNFTDRAFAFTEDMSRGRILQRCFQRVVTISK